METTTFQKIINGDDWGGLLQVVLIVVVGLPAIKLLASLLVRIFRHRLTPQGAMLMGKSITYTGLVLLIVTVLKQLQFDLTAVLGAAGIVGVAVGFASQTSLSNLISGLFLISEKPFQVGDLIKVGDTSGMVLSIDLLSVKLRTFSNQFVRIPNETLIKTEVTTITRFPIRRMDINLGVAYKEDIRRVVTVLKEIADRNPWCLDEPEPLVGFTGFGESQLNIFMGVWHARDDFLKLRDSILCEVKERLDAEGIEIPFPHLTFYVGDVTKPLPVMMTPPTPADGD